MGLDVSLGFGIGNARCRVRTALAREWPNRWVRVGTAMVIGYSKRWVHEVNVGER